MIGQSFVKSIGVFPGPWSTFLKTHPVVKGLNISQNHTVSQKQIADFFVPTSDCNDLETVCPNHLKFAVQVVPTMDPCGLKFQSEIGPKILAILVYFI